MRCNGFARSCPGVRFTEKVWLLRGIKGLLRGVLDLVIKMVEEDGMKYVSRKQTWNVQYAVRQNTACASGNIYRMSIVHKKH